MTTSSSPSPLPNAQEVRFTAFVNTCSRFMVSGSFIIGSWYQVASSLVHGIR